jgi:hypothetical protein
MSSQHKTKPSLGPGALILLQKAGVIVYNDPFQNH